MIQRIQSVYLVLVMSLGIILCFVPVLQLNTPLDASVQRMWTLGALGLDEITPDLDNMFLQPVELKGLWGLLLSTLLIPILACVDLFLFKKRLLQARLNIFTVLLTIGYYGIIYLYAKLAEVSMGVEWHMTVWCAIPAVCTVLLLMATRRILADEALVRSADRIR